jgi:hypothetical protein
MALPTFLELVNDVLVRLREPEVSTVNENVLSKLVGKFVNDAKRQVEDAYKWNALSNTLTATTSLAIFNYALTDSGARFKVIDAFNNTSKQFMTLVSTSQMNQWLLSDNPQQGAPMYYNFNGVDNNGDTKVDLYPIPDGAYQIFFNVVDTQTNLISDSDQMLVPSEPVTHLAYAKALVERGEDGGLQSSEAYALFKQVLADYVAIESSRYPEEDAWTVV